jgi:hypothetical protein
MNFKNLSLQQSAAALEGIYSMPVFDLAFSQISGSCGRLF